MPNWCDATVVEKKVWTDGLFTLTIETEEVQPFEPGQFLHLALDREDGKRVNRAYSVASPHGRRLEFFIVLVEDGELTPRLWKLEVGDHIWVSEKAAGRFTLEAMPPAHSLWLIGTGTGLAPYIAILRDEKVWKDYENIVVMHGVRYVSDLGYEDELKGYVNDPRKNFFYFPALTRQEVPGIYHGRLTKFVESGDPEKETGVPLSPEESVVMLCGNPAMLDAMVELLETKNLRLHRRKSPGQIVVERYW